MENFVLFFLVTCLVLSYALAGYKTKKRNIENRVSFYFKNIALELSLLGLIYLIDKNAFKSLNFDIIGRGYELPLYLIPSIIAFFTVPLVVELFTRQQNDLTEKEVHGYPSQFLPVNYTEFFIFIVYLAIGVAFEELLCRQVLFYSYYHTLRITGDSLLLVSALLFSVGHWYQGWKGLLSSFLIGIMLGKIFQMTGNILFPIVLRFFNNLRLCLVVFRNLQRHSNSEALN